MKKRAELRYATIAKDIVKRIQEGKIKDKLPTQRELIKEYKTSIRTIQEVYGFLKFHGYIRTSSRGTFVIQKETGSAFIPTQRMTGSK